ACACPHADRCQPVCQPGRRLRQAHTCLTLQRGRRARTGARTGRMRNAVLRAFSIVHAGDGSARTGFARRGG
ncbi:MAG: hypothetical protein AB1742_15190, partial [bacterium]